MTTIGEMLRECKRKKMEKQKEIDTEIIRKVSDEIRRIAQIEEVSIKKPIMTIIEALAVSNFVLHCTALKQPLTDEQKSAWKIAKDIINPFYIDIWKCFEKAEKE